VVPLHRLPTARPATQFQGNSPSPKKCREERKVRVTVKRAKHSERREVIPPTERVCPSHYASGPVLSFRGGREILGPIALIQVCAI
jgi:hypothetical protein